MASLILLATGLCAGCSSDQDVKYASVTATAKPTPRPTPNPDQAAGLITRFYRDIDIDSKESVKDLATIVSADFFRNHHDDFIADYAFINDPKVQIRSVTDRTVNYTLDYVYLTKGNGKLFWERTGRWTLNHGAKSGWVLESDAWDSVHLVGVSTPGHPDMVAVQDKVYGNGRHEFTYQGETLSFLAQGDKWHITPVATPAPAAAPTATYHVSASGDSNGGSSADNPTSTAQYQAREPQYQAPPPAPVSANCEEVSVEGVYDDGKVLALDDGRHLRVDDTDTVTSSLWIAPFDGLICNGDRFINKDDNEGVDLAY